MSKDQFEQLFSQFGRVTESKLLIDINTGQSRGAGLLRFETSQQARKHLSWQFIVILLTSSFFRLKLRYSR